MRSFDREKLRNLRLAKGYSFRMMSRLMVLKTGHRINRSAICHWEQGNCTPSLDSIVALGELFEVPLDYFFTPTTNYLLEALAEMNLEIFQGKRAGIRSNHAKTKQRRPEGN